MEDLFRKAKWFLLIITVLAIVIARYLVYIDERLFK